MQTMRCISDEAGAMHELVVIIEEEGDKYGMKLNYERCEFIKFWESGYVRMKDGARAGGGCKIAR